MTSRTPQPFSIVPGSAGGRLAPGDALPSVRETALQLAVNPMTVAKAYGLLELDPDAILGLFTQILKEPA